MFCGGGNKEVIHMVCAREVKKNKDKFVEVNKREEIDRLSKRKKKRTKEKKFILESKSSLFKRKKKNW